MGKFSKTICNMTIASNYEYKENDRAWTGGCSWLMSSLTSRTKRRRAGMSQSKLFRLTSQGIGSRGGRLELQNSRNLLADGLVSSCRSH